MRIGIIIGTNEAEVVWNAFRFANLSLQANHNVKIFLINKGVEIEDVNDEKHNIQQQTIVFLQNKGQIFACGTCLKARENQGSKVCPLSTMKDLLKIVEESDRILTFG